jgi:Protein of unknown function (DUF3237)
MSGAAMAEQNDAPLRPEFFAIRRDRRSVLVASAATIMLGVSGTVLPVAALEVSHPDTDGLQSEFVLEASIKRGEPMEVGPSKFGSRRVVNLLGGTFEGPKLKGEVLVGGTSMYVAREDGATMVDARYVLKTDDGAVILTRNEGLIVPGPEGAAPYIRTTASFEAPQGKYDWLNKALFLGVAHPNQAAQTSNLRIYRIL